MRPRGVLETALYCEDLEAAERFYAEVLGLEIVGRETDRHVFFRCGEGMLLLFNPAVTEEPETAPRAEPVPVHGARGPGHMAFRADRAELEEWKERLVSHGVAIERETEWPNGARSIYFRDPAGRDRNFKRPPACETGASIGSDGTVERRGGVGQGKGRIRRGWAGGAIAVLTR